MTPQPKTWALSLKIFLATTTVIATLPNYASSPVRRHSPRLPADVLSKLSEELMSRAEPLPLTTEIPADWSPSVLEKPIERTDALNDPFNRISAEFKIPKILRPRTAFWFDIYTKYGSSENVIHHVLYPWIVFKVVDTSAIENSNLHKWTKYHRAKALVRNEVARVRRTLRKLSKRKSFRHLKGLEKELYASLKGLKGSRRSVFRTAAQNVRSQLGQKDFFISGLKHSSRYLPYMEQEFREADLPVELTRIPFVESSFNTAAESKVGASGIWQIMPRVGKSYFIVNESIDERNAPLKASLAALDLLKRNYKQLKDWPLAVTAYNHGASGVKKALRKSHSKTLAQLISRYHRGSFQFASSNFYTSFLAVLHAEKYHNEIFKNREIERLEPLRYSVYQLKKRTRAKSLSHLTGLDKDTFLNYNLDLKDAMKKNAWIPRGFRFLVPQEHRFEIDAKTSLRIKPVREASAADKSGKNPPGKST